MLEAGRGRVKENCNHKLLKLCGCRVAKALQDHIPFGTCFQNKLSDHTLTPSLPCCVGLKHGQAVPCAMANSALRTDVHLLAPNAAGMSHH